MKYDKKICPIIDVDGVLAGGKQYDLDITISKDNRTVIYGIVKDDCGDSIEDAVVKLVEVDCDCKDERKPVSHTFTDKNGEFVFGPLCPDRYYSIEIWANKVKHSKICAKVEKDFRCLKGEKLDCDCKMDCKPEKHEKPEYPRPPKPDDECDYCK